MEDVIRHAENDHITAQNSIKLTTGCWTDVSKLAFAIIDKQLAAHFLDVRTKFEISWSNVLFSSRLN